MSEMNGLGSSRHTTAAPSAAAPAAKPAAPDPSGGLSLDKATAICVTTTLHKNDVGPKVKELQHALNRLGTTPVLEADGHYGDKTAAALLAVQVGDVRPLTAAVAADPTLQPLLTPPTTFEAKGPVTNKVLTPMTPDAEPFDARLSAGALKSTL